MMGARQSGRARRRMEVEDARPHASRGGQFPSTGSALEPPKPMSHAGVTSTIRVLIADSGPLVLGALAELIDRQRPRMETIGHAGSYARALYLAERDQPDVILLSVFQDTLDALGTVAAVLRICTAKVLLLKGMHDPVPVARLLRIGAAGVVIAEEPTESIVNAVVQVHEARDTRQPVVPEFEPIRPRPMARSLCTPSEGVSRLTGRERELIRVILDNPGAKYMVIGAQLGISEHTVHNHLSSIYHKLNLANRTDLLFYAVRNGLVDEPLAWWPAIN
jgi:DNA-binding NarL/FixJ family response regulator